MFRLCLNSEVWVYKTQIVSIHQDKKQKTHWNASDQLKFALAQWAKIYDRSPVLNADKTKPEIRTNYT